MNCGDTIRCSIVITDSGGSEVDPTTSTTITISSSYRDVVSGQAMTKDSVGNYHYDWDSSNCSEAGRINVVYTLNDNGSLTTYNDNFYLGVP